MRHHDQDGFTLNDLGRRLANIIRLGKVFEVNYQKAVARVQIGELQTGWLPWVANRTGKNITWHAIEAGEQVVVLSPSGQLEQGVILPALYSQNAPESSQDIHTTMYEDGSKISFDRSSGTLTANITGDAVITTGGKVTLNAGGKVSVKAPSAVITASNIAFDGNTSLGGAGGGQAVARVGDKVQVGAGSSAGLWPIVTGSSTVKSS